MQPAIDQCSQQYDRHEICHTEVGLSNRVELAASKATEARLLNGANCDK